MRVLLLAILVLSIMIPIGVSDAFGEITEATVTFVASHELTNSGGTPRYFDFNEDGTVLIIVEGATDKIEEYTLSTGYDLTTLSYAGNGQRFNSNSGGTGDGQPRGMEFNDDGTIMFVIGNAADEINQYSLSNGFDVSTASFTQKIDITGTVGTGPHGMVFNDDGTKIFLNNKQRSVIEFHIDAYDIKPLGSVVNTIDLSDHLTKTLRGMEFGDDGKKFLVIEADCASACFDVAKVHEFTLSTAYDVSSFTYEGEFDILEWEQDAQGLGFNPDGTSMYVLGTNRGSGGGGSHWNGSGEFIREFELSCPWQLTGTCGEKKGSSCWDCIRPAITYHGHSKTPDGFSINDAIFENNQELYNENPTIEATVGDMVTIKARAWDNRGPENIVRVYTYLGMYEEKPNWHESEAYIEYNIKKDKFEVNDKNKIFALVGASSEVAVNPYHEDGKLNRPLDLLDITFTIIFAKPMESSHIAIQTIDDAANYELVYFEDALKIKEKVILEIPEVPEEIIPEVPEEVIPEPEPPVKEPEPEVIPTALIKKGVLNFVDDDVPAKHYVKRYITETEYREWFDVNYSEYQFWEGIGITEERFEQIKLEIESEPKPKMIQTGFVLVPDDQKSFPLVEETYEPEPAELEPVKEKKGFFDWLFSLFG